MLLRIPIKVSGTAPNGKPINEQGEAVVVSRHGALLRLTSPLTTGTELEVMNGYSQEVEKFQVVYVSDKPKDGLYDIGVEFVAPREEFWGIRFPAREVKT